MSSSGDVILEHCDFIANHSTNGSGGGLSGNYVLAVDCTFLENVASHEGGGVNSRAGYSTFINCIFERTQLARTAVVFDLIIVRVPHSSIAYSAPTCRLVTAAAAVCTTSPGASPS